MWITQNFSMSELCKTNTGLPNEPPKHIQVKIRAMARLLQNVRNILGKPIFINSCYRSPLVNKVVGGSRTSLHLTGCAADISIYQYDDADKAVLERALKSYHPIEFIKYDTFWHCAFDFWDPGIRDGNPETFEQKFPDLCEPPRTQGDF